MIIIILYVTPILGTLVLAAPSFLRIARRIWSAAKSGEVPQYGESEKRENRARTVSDLPVAELRKLKPIVLHQVWWLVKGISCVFMFPIVMLRLSIATRWGSRVWWLSPVNLYELWRLAFLCLSYYYTKQNAFYTSFLLAAIVGTSAIWELVSMLEQKDGILEILRTPRHKVNIRGILESGLILVLAFAASYYAMSVINPSSFTQQLSILDSIYFSVITIATVGYGDMAPVAGYARILTIVEVLLGLLYILFVVGIFLSVYIKHQNEEVNRKAESS